jgi:hypothetical protein
MPLQYKGKLIDDLSREELIEALVDLEGLYRKSMDHLSDERDRLFEWVPRKRRLPTYAPAVNSVGQPCCPVCKGPLRADKTCASHPMGYEGRLIV